MTTSKKCQMVGASRFMIALHSKRSVLANVQREIRQRALSLTAGVSQLNKRVIKVTEEKIEEQENLETQLKKEITDLELIIRDPDEEKLTLQEFLNLSKNASAIVQSADVRVKDEICRLIFLNLTVNEEKIFSYQLKEPFKTLIEYRKILSGGEHGTTFELIY